MPVGFGTAIACPYLGTFLALARRLLVRDFMPSPRDRWHGACCRARWHGGCWCAISCQVRAPVGTAVAVAEVCAAPEIR